MRQDWLEKDFYSVLGVDRNASQKDIKKAFRRLAQEFHPDNNPGDAAAEARFKEIGEANDILSDPEKRAEYDQVRDAFSRGAFMGGPGGGGAQYVRMEDLGDIGDLFSSSGVFGGFSDLFGRGGRRGPQPGGDLEAEVTLSFNEAIDGTTRTLTVDGPEGRRSVTVKIPSGINEGARIKVKGKGRPGLNGGPAGDLYVKVRTGKHPIFTRTGKDLRIKVPLTYPEAVLGAEIRVPTLDGSVTLKVPAGSSPGKTLRVSGKGVKTQKGVGDLLVTLDVAVPDELRDEERELIEKLRAAESQQNPRSHLGV
jgi:molecular chaperone DnaJ